MKIAANNMINNIKNVDISQISVPILKKMKDIPTEQLIQYLSYSIILTISINSILNTKEYIVDNKQKTTKQIITHASISLILLWTAIYFLVR